jgi:hypothetical protein
MNQPGKSIFTALPAASGLLLRVGFVALAGQIYTNAQKIMSRRKIEKKN